MNEKNENLENKVRNIAEKYADMVEKRLDNATELTGEDIQDIHTCIQMLDYVVMTLERFKRINASQFD